MPSGPAGSMGSGALILSVTAVPGRGESRVLGRAPDGSWRISLGAPPVEGRANTELVRFLASEFGVCKADVKILRGQSSRRKLVRIEGSCSPPGWMESDG